MANDTTKKRYRYFVQERNPFHLPKPVSLRILQRGGFGCIERFFVMSGAAAALSSVASPID